MSKYPLFKLNDLASEWSKGQPFKKTDIAEHGQTPCIHYGELFTKYGVVINQCLSKTDVQGKRLSVSGDILFPASDVTPSGLARCSALMQDNVILGGDIIIMRPRHGNDPRYLSYAINYQKEQILQRVTGALIKHLSGNSLKSVIIPVPPLVDQVNLVSKLEKISALITFRKLQLEKLDQLASSRFIEMFGHQGCNEKNMPIGKIDDVAEIYLGLTHTPTYVDCGVKFISAKNTSCDYLDLSDVKYISREEFEKVPRGAKPQIGDVLFSRVGSNLGHPVILDISEELCTFVSLGFLRSKGQVTNIYLKYWMKDEFFTEQIKQKVVGGGQPNLNTGWLKEFKIIIPPLELQNEFAAFIEQLDKSKVIGEKQGFMLEKITCHDIL